jgi:hypothetical protein
MIDPRVTGDCERIYVQAGKLVMLKQVLCIPHVPPDIRVVHIWPIKDEEINDADYEHG